MMPLTVEQLLEADGKCFNCGCGIIMDNMITSTSCVFVRRGQKKKYWAESNKLVNRDILRLKKRYPEKWELYLADTEKIGIPGFIDPKSHPKTFVCLAVTHNEPTNIFHNTEKCVIHKVDYYKNIRTTKESDVETFKETLRAGVIFKILKKQKEKGEPKELTDYTLETGNQILLTAGKKFVGVFEVTKGGLIPVKHLLSAKLVMCSQI